MLNIRDMLIRRYQKEYIVTVIQLLLLIVLVWLIVASLTASNTERIISNSNADREKLHEAALQADSSGRYLPDYPPASYIFLLTIPHSHGESVQNILMRYALLNKVPVALPRDGHLCFCFPLTFSR